MQQQFTLKKLAFHVALALILFGIVATVAYWYLVNYTQSGQAIAVPNLSEMHESEAKTMLNGLLLEAAVVDSVYDPKKKGGVVLAQDPVEGSMVKEGRKIYLTVYRYSAPMVKLPDVIDQSLPLAIAKLNSYGFKVGELVPRASDCTECVVGVELRGKAISAGARLSKGARVDLLVGQESLGEPTQMPSLYGLTSEEARTLLQMHVLSLGATPHDPYENEGDSLLAVVYKQGIAPGNEVPMGSSIEVFLTTDRSKIPPVNVDSIKARLK